MDTSLHDKTSTFFIIGGLLLVGLAGRAIASPTTCSSSSEESSTTFESHICDHDGNGLVELSKGTLWHVTAKFHGNGPHWRRMIIYRPPRTESLVVLSPTAVPNYVMSEIERLGRIDYLIVPNSYHRTDAAVFKGRYPSAKVASPPGWVRKAVSEIVPVDLDSRELAHIFKESIKVVRIGGLCDPKESEGDFEYAYEFRCSSGSSSTNNNMESWAYAVTDGLFNFTEKTFANWLFGCRGIEQPDGSTTPKVGRIGKFMMHSKGQCAEFYREMSKRDDVSMILMAHGDVFIGDTKKAFADIASDLVGE